MVEIIPVSTTLELRAADESHVPALHQLVLKNKAWLQQSLDWPQYVTSQDETRKHVQGNILLHQRGYAKNKAAYIGYWLDESLQGQGVISQSLQALMAHYVRRGDIRRFVIKCRVDNQASNAVARRNHFTLEGCMKQAEYLNGDYHDVNMYARIIDTV
ncbi:ribosomal-protein-L7/L12-serine acetyltransferase [Salmonella enterica subsp. salamae]|uniref:Ribosomal-protein-L7/L12-serine acetyltransferase n=1 Tax=Salmonella enterica TaxID=28901 RepID=A0A379R1U7_SALER|nr:GNAT family N-acetyltransferase [Salmonella enterica subsp. salamae]EDV1417404.1 GNAT family N-acetyltransferase [Salmonella enterica subsp. salamae]SUF70337.1 ribosomal-protein-L7/L12-serine acetyltransferase [Salmonella enterica]SUI20557.1 ribosomal-protein-L7/L12-serine acetyltransferase [Salmonella enterica subsp. salamae]